MTPPESKICRTCKVGSSRTGQKVCAACQRKIQQWLDGGYEPQWNGVVIAPADADDPRSLLDRALMLRPNNDT